MRVLFVGNSFVFFNRLPGLVQQLARAGGRALETESVAYGGMTLLGHLDAGDAVARIRAGGCDAVVLQEQSTRPILAPAAMRAAARTFQAEIGRAGAKTVLYLTWARRTRPDQQAAMDATYYGIARELGAVVAPVGPAWRRALAERPDLVLHREDNAHPAPAGTYLAACVFYATLCGRSPVGLGVRTVRAGDGDRYVATDLPADEVTLLQRVAWKTVASAPDPPDWRGDPDAVARCDEALAVDLDTARIQEAFPLHGLTPAQIQLLREAVPRRQVPAGTTLVVAGDSGDTAYLVLDGTVRNAPAGGRAVTLPVGRMGVAFTFGTEGLLGRPYGATTTTEAGATVLPLRAAALDALAARDDPAQPRAALIRRQAANDRPARACAMVCGIRRHADSTLALVQAGPPGDGPLGDLRRRRAR